MAGSLSPFQELKRLLELAYKLALTLVVGCLLAAVLTAYFHYRPVSAGVGDAERLVGQGQYAQADALAYQLAFDPEAGWARCFPGYFRTFGQIRVRCLTRSGQSAAALEVAEAMRQYEDFPVERDSLETMLRQPFPWLQNLGLSLVGNLTAQFAPIERPGLLAGYEVLLAELVAMKDVPALQKLAADITERFPMSPLSVYATAALGQADPVHFPTSAFEKPEPPPAPSTNLPPAHVETSPAPEAVTAAVAQVEDVLPPAAPAAWGIVTNASAQAFNPTNGQPLRVLKAGDVLVIEGACSIGDQPALTGTLILNNRSVPDLAFMGGDLEIRQGEFNQVPQADVALLSRLAEIALEEADLALQAAREGANQTPEEKAYRLSMDRMAQFQKESKSLQDRLEKATGQERTTIIDRLRLMKYQEQALMRDLQTKKETLDMMAGRTATAKPRALPKLISLRQEKQAILKRLGDSGS